MKKYFLLFSLLGLGLAKVKAQTIVALTSAGSLMQIADASMPGMVGTSLPITGITTGQSLVGIDYRPNTGELYGLGYNNLLPLANAQLYVINSVSGVATPIGSAISLALGTMGIGFDFNPTVDRIRVVAENGANYRLHPTTGALVATDGNLAFASTDPNASVTPAIAACAYTNSYIGSEATTLFDYDKTLNILASQIPPNNGTLNTIGSSSIVSTGSNLGMDIYFNPITKTNTAYLNAKVGGMNNLYRVNTATGAASIVGAIGTGTTDIREIAVKIDRNIPAVYPGRLLYGLTKVNRNLVKFSSDNPELIRELLPITGLTAGQMLVGMDVRPLDLNLYALGYHDTTRTYQLYSINTITGAAMAVGSPGKINLGMGQKIGFDFNPTVDRIRVVSTNDSNFRLNPITGTLAATDTSLSYNASDINAGKNPNVSSVAYTNSYKGTTSTAMFGLDDSLNSFIQVTPPNQGFINSIASSVLSFNLADLTNDIDFYYDSTNAMNIGYIAANTGMSVNDVLYTVSTTGAVMMVDTIGLGVQLYDIAAQLNYTGSTTSITELGNQSSFRLYPNPANDVLHIVLSTTPTQKTALIIRDIFGKKLQTIELAASVSTATIDVAGLTAGLYLIDMEGDATSLKFVKN